MQVPIINGIYTDASSEFRTSYPRNLVPVPKQQGISKGYLRPAEGIIQYGLTPGLDRGGINWNNVCYRVLGTQLCRIEENGNTSVVGDVGGYTTDIVTFAYSFDMLAVCSNFHLFYYDAVNGVRQVTNVNLGKVVTFIWVDGYFMTTDGKNLIVTDLNDPFNVNPLKYGSSDANPEPIVGLCKLHDQPFALNRYTIDAYQNVGGNLFPFQVVLGSTIMRGPVGTHAYCVFGEVIAFLGSGRNEPCAVYTGLNAQSVKISTREIDTIISKYTETELSTAVVETRITLGHQFLYIHLSDRTLVYDAAASQILGESVWFYLTSSLVNLGQYRARNFVWCYNKWIVGDPTKKIVGYMTYDVSSHYGDVNGWDFGTTILYNKTNGALFHELELVALTGNVAADKDPVIWTSYSTDGRTWSMERPRHAGKQGKRAQRLNWLQNGNMLNWRIQKFRGTSDSHISMAALECRIEALYV